MLGGGHDDHRRLAKRFGVVGALVRALVNTLRSGIRIVRIRIVRNVSVRIRAATRSATRSAEHKTTRCAPGSPKRRSHRGAAGKHQPGNAQAMTPSVARAFLC